ncbi:MAG: mannose-1-phosphate guanylyltransferase, partial [Kiritimatiellae bacterium]|nr:mannose-1-phosphate guanylyltransferase [Kiritimatiellia bacterium]
MRRDTGAAIALGTAAAGGGVLGFFPSDQLVADAGRFRRALSAAVAKARRTGAMVTIGIKPQYPSTSFGYIDPKSGRFVEKPRERRAKEYLAKGYLWNAGMFIAKAEVFMAAFAAHAPELSPLCGLKRRQAGFRSLAAVYEKLPRISFDYAVMERLGRVAVVKGDFGWDDVGSYGAFDKYFPHDAHGNVREGPCTAVDAADNICVTRTVPISLLGVKNLVVVSTPDGVLVADKNRITEMKKLFR